MNIKTLKTESDYETDLSRIGELMGARANVHNP